MDATQVDKSSSRNALVNLGVCKAPTGVRENIGQAEVLSLVFAVFSKPFPGYHHGHGRFCHQIVAEGTQQNTAKRSAFMRAKALEANIPFQSTPTSRSKDYQCRFQEVNLSSTVRGAPRVSKVFYAYHFCNHVLGAFAMEDLNHHSSLQAGLPEKFNASVGDLDGSLVSLLLRFPHGTDIDFGR